MGNTKVNKIIIIFLLLPKDRMTGRLKIVSNADT